MRNMEKRIKPSSFFDYLAKMHNCDKNTVSKAVKYHGGALEFASKALHAGYDAVLATVKNKGYMLKYASELLANDR